MIPWDRGGPCLHSTGSPANHRARTAVPADPPGRASRARHASAGRRGPPGTRLHPSRSPASGRLSPYPGPTPGAGHPAGSGALLAVSGSQPSSAFHRSRAEVASCEGHNREVGGQNLGWQVRRRFGGAALPVDQPHHRGHHGRHAAGARAPDLPALPARLPAGRHRVRRRAVLRQRRAAGQRRPSLSLIHPGAAARDHAAHDPGRADGQGDRHGGRDGHRPDTDHARQRGGRGARRAARAASRPGRSHRVLRDHRGLPR